MADLLASLPDPTPDALRAARAAAGHSQAQAARIVGMHVTSWARCEQDNAASKPLGRASWALYLLAAGQHPAGVVASRPTVDAVPPRPAHGGGLRGFGLTLSMQPAGARHWYIGADGVKRWVDNDLPA